MSEAVKSNAPFGEGRFRLVFEHAPVGIAIVGMDFQLQKVNEALCVALGYTSDELLSKTIMELTHPDDFKKDRALAEKLFRGEIPRYRIEKRFITKDGRLIWLDLSAFVIRGKDDESTFGLAIVENITKRKRAQSDLKTSEERYRSFIVNSSEAIWRFELDQPISISTPIDEQIDLFYQFAYLAECNDAMARLYGHDRAEDIVGKRASEVLPSANPTNLESVKACFNNHYRLHDMHSTTTDAAGQERFFSSSVFGIVVNGYLLRIWGTQRDETARIRAENELLHSRQQLRSLAAYLQDMREKERAGLAREMHDVLGQSLTVLKMDLSRIKKEIVTSGSDIVGQLDSASELIDETIAKVKTISTELRPGVLDKFGLTAAIEWLCGEFQSRSGIKCNCELTDEDQLISPGQSTTLFRILQEALANIARHSEASNVSIVLNVDQSEILMTIADDGKGITEEQIAAPDSLGLLGMRERTDMLHGTFSAQGRPGQSILTVRLPLNEQAK